MVAHVLRVDDVLDAFAVHGACGLWSLLAVGLIADGALPPSDAPPSLATRPADPPPAREVVGAFAGGMLVVALGPWRVRATPMPLQIVHWKS